MKIILSVLSVLLLLSSGMTVFAKEVYLEPAEFVATYMPSSVQPKSLWITGDLRTQAEEVLEHRPLKLRERYWQDGEKTLWILEEIGKEEPITAGFVVENNQLIETQVLIFRESRGWEIHYPTFTAQFKNAGMNKNRSLDRSIDGISGATLSVNAMRKLARLALTYHQHICDKAVETVATTSTISGDPRP